MAILEIDKDGKELRTFASQREAAAANGITLSGVQYSCNHNGKIVKSCGRGFIRKGEGQTDVVDKSNCLECAFGLTDGGREMHCGYLLITGKMRPCRGLDCEIWKDHPKGDRPGLKPQAVKRKRKKKQNPVQADELLARIFGKEME